MINNMNKTLIRLNNETQYHIQKRFMHRATNMFHYVGTKLMPPTTLNVIQKRNIPNHGYIFVEIKKKIVGKDPKTGQGLSDQAIKNNVSGVPSLESF